MYLFTYLLVKQTFWEELKEEFRDVLDMFSDFFLMIKEVTYDVLAKSFGGDIVNMFIIAIGVIALMLILLAIINR